MRFSFKVINSVKMNLNPISLSMRNANRTDSMCVRIQPLGIIPFVPFFVLFSLSNLNPDIESKNIEHRAHSFRTTGVRSSKKQNKTMKMIHLLTHNSACSSVSQLLSLLSVICRSLSLSICHSVISFAAHLSTIRVVLFCFVCVFFFSYWKYLT